MEKNYDRFLKDVIDIHIHTSPDIRTRKLNDIQLAEEAKRVGAKAIVIKSHVVPTMDRATIAALSVPGIGVYGGVTLNQHVGGINRLAVKTALTMGAKMIWLPTSYSKNERARIKENDGVVIVKDRKVVPELLDVFDLIAQADVALCTGHSTPYESQVVIEEAKKHGIKKIVVNHPEWSTVNMSIDEQKSIIGYGVYFERCYARSIGGGRYDKNFRRNIEAIEQLGVTSTIMATDGGQIENPIWSQAFGEYISFMLEQGLTQEELDIMTKTNPAQILGI